MNLTDLKRRRRRRRWGEGHGVPRRLIELADVSLELERRRRVEQWRNLRVLAYSHGGGGGGGGEAVEMSSMRRSVDPKIDFCFSYYCNTLLILYIYIYRRMRIFFY